MDWQGWVSVGLTGGALLTLIFTRIAPHFIMLGVLTLLTSLGILSSSEALAGFSNSGLITVAAMFVVAAGIHSSGGADLLVKSTLGSPNDTRNAMLRIFAPVMPLSGFLNNTPVVATMIPAIHLWSRKISIAPSKLMIPLSYSAILGGTVTMIGTSTNLVVNGQYVELTGNPEFSLFSISVIGLPVAIGGGIFMWLLFPKWLPNRGEKNAFANLREFTLEVSVDATGPLVGQSIGEAGLRQLKRVYLAEIVRDNTILTAVPTEEVLRGGDRLVFTGDTEAISDLLRINGIIPSPENGHADPLGNDRAERRLVEAVVSPHCSAVGLSIKDARFRDRYGAVVLAVARNGDRVQGNLGTIRLSAGDTLLLEARPAFVSRQKFNKDFLLINDLDVETPRHEKALIAWLILVAVVGCAGFGVLSMLNAALLGAGLMVITGCCSMHQAEKSLDLSVILTIASSFALGAALLKTGMASAMADNIIEFSFGKPWLMLVLTYIVVVILTETITNNAAAILTLPVVLEITEKANLNQEPFIFAVMIAASASFATPMGYQTNLMVYGPGGYRYTDFLRVGLPMSLFVGTLTISILLLGWPLVR